MIDTLSVISNGGIVLWERSSNAFGRRSVVNRVIQEVFLEDRTGVREFVADDCKVNWALENNALFFVVAVYPKFLSYLNISDVLCDFARSIVKKYGRVENPLNAEYDLSVEYTDVLVRLESGTAAAAAAAAVATSATDAWDEQSDGAEDAESSNSCGGDDAEEGGGETNSAMEVGGAHQRGTVLVNRSGRVIGRKGHRGAAAPKPAAAPQDARRKKPVKQATRWDQPTSDPAAEAQQKAAPTEAELAAQAEMQRATFLRHLPNGSVAPVREKEWENQPRGRVATWLRAYVGNRELDSQDFESVIPKLREKLIAKNVAVEIAENVCNSVEVSLKGTKLGTFDSLYQTIETAMVAALRRILEPKHEVNILRAVAAARARKKPFSIVFCGVNGVGKSTTLAKITYWLQQNGHSPLLAAGDTFRHGAVEQLEVHGRCLGVPVFQMGYGTDPSAVAAAAIAQAARQKLDVVLIDTAGRMQDHVPRMRALAKLIHDNQPDLVLFVGEALVGNNGIDQLRRYNQCLVDFAPVGTTTRGIDGIILTKFDTIDEKVGAALSMVYELGQPIVFVGVGQTYQDLKVIEPDVVVSALMQ